MEATFTLGQIYTAFLGFLALIISLGGAGAVIAKIIAKAKSPNEKQDVVINAQKARIDELEKKIVELETHIKSIRRIVDDNANWQKVMSKAVLALLDHGINGNNIEPMKDSSKELREYLVER